MKRQITIEQYRSIDLTLFALMLVIFETIVVKASGKWFSAQPYTFSLTAALTAIVLMRWGIWGAVEAVLGGIVFCAAYGGSGGQYVIYGAGNLFSLGALGLIKLFGPENIRLDTVKSLIFAAAVQILMHAGRAAAALCFGHSIKECAAFFTTDALSCVITMVIIWIARRLDGIFENQKIYLLRINEEKEKGGCL